MISLPPLRVFWDLDSDPSGNVSHIAEHGITKDEVEAVLMQPECVDVSRSSGHRIAIGETAAGRTILVVFEEIDECTVYPITAYDVEG
jgi:uncharacterized DUF497 family protein